MKAIICLLIALMACSVIVSAIEPLPKTKCVWTRPATEYRPAKEYTGSWGRYSDGSIRCFAPFKGKNHATVSKPKIVCKDVTTTENICEDEEVCEEICHWHHQCTFWKHGRCWNYVWIKECHQECHTETSCHEESKTERICS